MGGLGSASGRLVAHYGTAPTGWHADGNCGRPHAGVCQGSDRRLFNQHNMTLLLQLDGILLIGIITVETAVLWLVLLLVGFF
jgi:hypothetical protein